jgi:propionyl-CoA carboxylase alpha chain
MGNQAVRLAEKVGYSSAGTVEFIVDKNKNFYFLEMNTRLQVEHPVTELITGVDLVEQMICIAYGEKLRLTQDKIVLNGSAIESRIYAENPYKNFLPSIGRLTKYHPPQEKTHDDGSITRNDTGVREGDEVSMFYDPMIAKLCSWGKTREISIKRMETALDNFLLEGIDHNIPFLSSILGSKRFKSGDLTTSFIEDEYPKGYHGRVLDKNEEWILSTLFLAYHLSELSKDFLIDNGFSEEWEVQIKNKNIASETINFQFKIKKSLISKHEIYIKPLPLKNVSGIINDYIQVNLQKNYVTKLVTANIKLFDTNKTFMPELIQCRINNTVPNLELSYRGIKLSALILPKHVANYNKYMKPIKIIDKSNLLLCPMPGKLIKVLVKEGDTIEEGQALCVVEAMKMENTLLAEKKCIINKINFVEGDTVSIDETIMELNFEK